MLPHCACVGPQQQGRQQQTTVYGLNRCICLGLLQVHDAAACADMGMGCYLGVAEASQEPPQFIHLTYTPKGEVKKKVAIVGKGLTFDSGATLIPKQLLC